MNKIKLLLPVVAGLLLTAQAFAQHSQVSARINAGVNFLNADSSGPDFDTGFIVGGAIDYKIMPQVRVGISYDYLDNDVNLPIKKLDDSQSVILANAYYDLTGLIKNITPYLGVGLGYNHSSFSSTLISASFDKGGFAWRVAVGANYNLTHEVEIGLGYSYIGSSIDSTTFTNNSILASVGYNF